MYSNLMLSMKPTRRNMRNFAKSSLTNRMAVDLTEMRVVQEVKSLMLVRFQIGCVLQIMF
jgi:hypothetical protein